MKSKIFLCSLICVCGLALFAQAPKIEFPSASPACTIKQRVGLTDIEVVYSRPSMKGRQIFGNVVPFGTIWRTGGQQRHEDHLQHTREIERHRCRRRLLCSLHNSG